VTLEGSRLDLSTEADCKLVCWTSATTLIMKPIGYLSITMIVDKWILTIRHCPWNQYCDNLSAKRSNKTLNRSRRPNHSRSVAHLDIILNWDNPVYSRILELIETILGTYRHSNDTWPDQQNLFRCTDLTRIAIPKSTMVDGTKLRQYPSNLSKQSG
jgi:hypothetical protein